MVSYELLLARLIFGFVGQWFLRFGSQKDNSPRKQCHLLNVLQVSLDEGRLGPFHKHIWIFQEGLRDCYRDAFLFRLFVAP